MENQQFSRSKKIATSVAVVGVTALAPALSFAAVDTAAIDGALTDIASVAGAMLALAVGALAAWAVYYKLKG